MRALKLIANIIFVLVVLPVTIVGILGMLLSPFQTVARATEPQEMERVSDLMLSEAVEEHVQQTLDERAALTECAAGVNATDAPESEERANALESDYEDVELSEVSPNDAPDAADAAGATGEAGASYAVE